MPRTWSRSLVSDRAARVKWDQVAAFRLARHHLGGPSSSSPVAKVAADMMGAQAQVVQAAMMSLRARTRTPRAEMEGALWRKRTLVRGWAMRRTLFLLPSDDFPMFVRGTSRRPEYNYRYALKRAASKVKLDRLLELTFEELTEPTTRRGLASALKSLGYRVYSRAGGGWGDSRAVPWVEVGSSSLPVGFLIHTMAAKYALCSGPNEGNEATYVRADRWLPHWKDVKRDEAELELLLRYLRAFGPATVADYAIWVGMYIRDAKEVWSKASGRIAPVDVEGQGAWALASDVPLLEGAKLTGPNVHLLPFFDSFILGHRSHRNIVDESNHTKVYRPQGWVSPVLLVDGRAAGVWSFKEDKGTLEVAVSPFSELPRAALQGVRDEASGLAEFLGCSGSRVRVA